MELSSRFQGCIMGGAIGDALGMPWEFMIPEKIESIWNRMDYAAGDFQSGLGTGQYTDDTMSMRCLCESIAVNGTLSIDDYRRRLIDWYRTGDLRGIGRTSLTALQALSQGRQVPDDQPIWNMEATNGAAMRIAPVGLFFCQDESALKDSVIRVSALTHRHPESVAGAMAVAFSVAHGVLGDIPADELMAGACEFTRPSLVSEQLGQCQDMLGRGVDCAGAIKALGNSPYVVESVPSSIYCACSNPESYEGAVVAAIMGGGDTDTMGSMAGAIAGARQGVNDIPPRWLEGLEDSAGLMKAANGLFKAWSQQRGRPLP